MTHKKINTLDVTNRHLSDTFWLMAIVFAALGIGVFVHHSVNQVREGLPALVLKQQQEIANVLHDLSDLANDIGQADHHNETIDVGPILVRVKLADERLREIRKTYNFDNLVGASAIHAVAKPALDDMQRWLSSGLGLYGPNSPQVLHLVQLRADGASDRIRELFGESNARALALVNQQGERLELFRQSLVLYLAAFGILTIGIIVLFVRQRNAESSLALERRRLADSLQNIGEGYALYDADDRLILFNGRFASLVGHDFDRLQPGATFEEILESRFATCCVESATGAPIRFPDRLERHRHPRESFEVKTADNRILRVSERKTDDGGTVAVYTDISDLKRAQDRLQHLATHDALTGLPNRVYFQDSLEKSLSRARRQRRKLAVIVFDLDRFKLVNDTLGHACGDELLCKIAMALKSCMRADEILARLGGDEFAAILEGVDSWSQVSATAERTLDTLCRAFDVSGSEVFVTTSIGIAIYPEDGNDSKALLRNADAACYHAKSLGRNNFQFFTEDLNLRATGRLTLEKHLRTALDRNELSLVYQPLIEMASGKVTGMEALLRWVSPDVGPVPPDEFIPIAEESGLIIPIGEWVLNQACVQNQAWRDSGLPPIQVLVNVSAQQLRLKGFARVVKGLLRKCGLHPSGLVLEITESIIMDNLAQAEGTLRELHESGVGISIDDFGVGYSSLGTLKRFPVATLKIDRSFVRDISTDKDDFEIVSAVTAMAHNLHIKVVAEGVETREQLKLVEQLHCDTVQGYWFSHPMAADDARSFLGRKSVNDTIVPITRPTR